MSCGDCLDDKKEYIRTVQCCIAYRTNEQFLQMYLGHDG